MEIKTISIKILLLLVSLFTYLSSFSQDNILFAQSLNVTTIYTSSYDRFGNLWIATNNGMFSFDGNTIENYSNNEGLTTNDILKIKTDNLNYIWPLGFDNETNYIFNDQVFSVNAFTNLNIREYAVYFTNNNLCYIYNEGDLYQYNIEFDSLKLLDISNYGEFLSFDYLGRSLFKENNSLICVDLNNQNVVFKEKGLFYPKNRRFENTFFLQNEQNQTFIIKNKGLVKLPNANHYLVNYANLNEVMVINNDTIFHLNNYKIGVGYKIPIHKDTNDNRYPKVALYGKSIAITYNDKIVLIKDYQKLKNSKKYKTPNYKEVSNLFILNDKFIITPKYKDLYEEGGKKLTNDKVVVSSYLINEKNILVSHQKGMEIVNTLTGSCEPLRGDSYPIYIKQNLDSSFLFLNQKYLLKLSENKIDKLLTRDYDRFTLLEKINKQDYILLTEQDSLFIIDSVGKINYKTTTINISDLKRVNDSLVLMCSPKGMFVFNTFSKKTEELDFNKTYFKLVKSKNNILCISNNSILVLNNKLKEVFSYTKFSFDQDQIKYAQIFDSSLVFIKGSYLYSTDIIPFNRSDISNTKIKVIHPNVNYEHEYVINLTPRDLNDFIKVNPINFSNDKNLSVWFSVNNSGTYNEVQNNEIHFNVNNIYSIELKVVNSVTLQESQGIKVNIKSDFSFFYRRKKEIIIFLIISLFIYGSSMSFSYLNKKRKQRALEKAKNDLKVLQLQMNPHFLFNSLNTFQGLIFKTDKLKANSFLISLNNLFRYYFNYSEKLFITLEEELKFIREYITVQQIRFENVFEYKETINVKHSLNQLYIPSMIIQPIIENSIQHGFKNFTEGGEITLAIEEQKKDIIIYIKDNGEGGANASSNDSKRYSSTEVIRKKINIVNWKRKGKAKFEILTSENGMTSKIILNKKLCLRPLL